MYYTPLLIDDTAPSSEIINAPAAHGTKRRRREEESTPSCKRQLFTGPTHLKEHLGRNWYFTTSTFQTTHYFHFRVHEVNDKGVAVPTKKGVALIARQMKNLLDCTPTLMETADKIIREGGKEYSFHLGYGTYVTVKQFEGIKYVDIRRFWKPEGCENPVHTRKGAMLQETEFTKFMDVQGKLLEEFPNLNEITHCDCIFQPNQLGFLKCSECNPFDCLLW